MAQPKTLTESQVALLRWITNGRPDGVMDGYFHRISAAALRNRGLVKTSGRGPTWAATTTKAGQEYLNEVDGPAPPTPRKPNESMTQRLVEDVIAAGGTLRVPRGHRYSDAIDYARRARLAERQRKLPPGKRLTLKTIGEELEISLAEALDPNVPFELIAVPVAAKVSRYHAAVRHLRDSSDRHEVSRAMLGRATRILQAIAIEAERRGWQVKTGDAGDLALVVSGVTFYLRLAEEGVHPRGMWEEQVRRSRRISSDWGLYRDRTLSRGAFDAEATGRLRLELIEARSRVLDGRQRRWADRQSWTLEERLPHLFREIEERILEAKQVAEDERIAAAEAAERARIEAEERALRWQTLIDEARRKLTEQQRAERLRSQATAWREAELLGRYCEAMEAAYGGQSQTRPWLAWVRSFISQLDPLAQAPTMPAPPEPGPEALQPFLPEGWSAHGPEEGSVSRWGGAQRYAR